MSTKRCIGYSFGGVSIAPHDLEWNADNFPKWALDPSRPTVRCKECDRFRRTKVPPGVNTGTERTRSTAAIAEPVRERPVDFATMKQQLSQEVEDDEIPVPRTHDYVADAELVSLWQSIVSGAMKHGDRPATLIFYGPSGSGKSEGAQYLADLVGLPLTKVDAASMTDPESWFGTREVVVQEGVSVTKYIPSAFVENLQKPGVTFIDEMNRVDDDHRNVLLPITDAIGRVTNPLTGEPVVRHPHHFIIMAGNRGLEFTGTSAVDPAFTKRAYVVEFDYIDERLERKVAQDATGCDTTTAMVFVKFANETRAKARGDSDFVPISTREVIAACRLVARGLSRDLAAKFTILNGASSEGNSASYRQELQSIWNGVRVTKEEVERESEGDAKVPWTCPTHGRVKIVPAGVSKKTGRPYNAFRACPVAYCEETELKTSTIVASSVVQPSNPAPTASQTTKTCSDCGTVNPPGRVTICTSCGGVLP